MGQHIQDRIKAGVKFICNDFLLDNSFENNTFDVIIDSCAIGCSMNIELTIKKISEILKPGGYFITTGDTSLKTVSGNFINPHAWIELSKKYNLELVGEYDNSTDNLFLKYECWRDWGPINIVRLVFLKSG